MKEINFLPDWYIQDRIKNRKRQEYYAVVILVIVDLIAWNIFINEKAALAKTGNQYYTRAYQAQCKGELKYNIAQAAYTQLKTKAAVLDSMDSKIKISTVLAELSYITGDKIILSSLEIRSVPFEDKSSKSNGQIRVASDNSQQTNSSTVKNRFKIVIQGIASSPGEVALLITSLEESKYFTGITPGFSKNNEIDGRQVSEFEISCFLANYTNN
jgi:hypothetical protein